MFNRYQSIHAVCGYLCWLEWWESLKEECERWISCCSIAINQFMPFVGIYVDLVWCVKLKEEWECRINGSSIAINQPVPFVGMYVGLDDVKIWKKNMNVGLTVVQSLSINSFRMCVSMLV